MKVAMLVEAKMLPVPAKISTLSSWGYVSVVDSDNGKSLSDGNHMYLEGADSDFQRWLSAWDCVWITKPGTHPMVQAFEAVHIAKE